MVLSELNHESAVCVSLKQLVIFSPVLIDITLDSDTSLLCLDSTLGVDLTLDDSCIGSASMSLSNVCSHWVLAVQYRENYV